MKRLLLCASLSSACSLIASAPPLCGDGVEDEGELCLAPATAVVGISPIETLLRDLDGDGNLDLLTANFGLANDPANDTVTVARGDGVGGFAPPIAVEVGDGPVGLDVADLNGDTLPDLAVANSGRVADANGDGLDDDLGTLTLAFQNLDGTFTAQAPLALAGSLPQLVRAGDVNGDGAADLVIVVRDSERLSVLLNDPAALGTFPVRLDLALNPDANGAGQAKPSALTLLDLEGDGDLDIVTSNFVSADLLIAGDQLIVFQNDAGAFTALPPIAVEEAPITATPADLDGDGDLDLAVVNQLAATVSLVENLSAPGAISLAVVETLATSGAQFEPIEVAAGDLNRDGQPDLALSLFRQDGALELFLGNAPFSFASVGTIAAGVGPQFLDVADINGDERIDLVAGESGAAAARLFFASE